MKRIIVLFTACITAVLLTVSVSAETIYEYFGFQYTIINNYSVSVCGRTDTSASLTIPNKINDRTVADIANRAFLNDTILTDINFFGAKGLERIGMFAFKGCINLSGDLVLPEQITKIETGSFQECASLSQVDIKAQVNELPSQVFYKCDSLTTVILNNNIRTIGSFAFADCQNLSYLELSRNITSIAQTAFDGDENLTLGVYFGTYAHIYAVENNINYILLDNVKLGDADGDGAVQISDVTLIQRYLAELDIMEGIYLYAADANRDGTLDIADATIIQMYIAEYDTGYPIGEVMTQ